MDKLAIVSIAVLSLVPNLNYQTPTLDTPRSDSVVSSFLQVPAGGKFPDRSKEIAQAQQIDKQRELDRLQAIEAQRQALIAEQAKKAVETPVNVSGGTTDAKILALKMCESGNNYANKKNPTYRGAYQYDRSTWNNFGGYADPADAPPEVQDAKFAETYARRGGSPWPVCSRKAGL